MAFNNWESVICFLYLTRFIKTALQICTSHCRTLLLCQVYSIQNILLYSCLYRASMTIKPYPPKVENTLSF